MTLVKTDFNPGAYTEALLKTEADSEKKGFPVQVFPANLQKIIHELDSNCSYPPAVTSAAMLAAAGVAMGNNLELYFKNEWIEAAIVFICVVGDKGSGKSHAINTLFKPFIELESSSFKKFTAEHAAWQSRKDQAKIEKYPFEDPEPTWERFIVDNVTMEKLAEILNENQQGIILINDELRAWFKSFTQYDSDSVDKWLRIFNRSRIVVDRMSRGTTQINSPFVSVIGSIQPEVLERLITPDFKECGLIDRMLFTSIEGKLKYSEGDIDSGLLLEWSNLLQSLMMHRHQPRFIYLSSEAKDKFTTWKKGQIDFLNENETERILGGKWDNYLLRFALILHCLHNPHTAPDNITGEILDKAIELVKYFQGQYYKIFGDKDNYLIRKLSILQREVYSSLPGEFLTSQAVMIARDCKMPERTIKRWLNDKSYFRCVRHGQYQKTLEI